MIDETRQQNQTATAGGTVEATGPRELVPAPRAPGLPARQDTAPGGGRGIARRLTVALAVLLLVAGSAGGGWYWWQQRQRNALPAGIASANGRIEAEPVDVATKYAGRLEAVLVDEGAMVRAGQVVARMDTRELGAALRQAEAQERQAQRSLDARRATVVQQRSQLTLAQGEFERTRALLQTGAATRQAFDQRQAARDSAEAALNVAGAQVAEAEHAVQAAREAAERIRTQVADSILVAPIDGRVQYRLAEPGEVLAAGGKVRDPARPHRRLHDRLPARPTRPGAAARHARRASCWTRCRTTSMPATVTFVSPQAQFTPKQVETAAERDKLMFRVKLAHRRRTCCAVSPSRCKTGLPGVAYVRLDRRRCPPGRPGLQPAAARPTEARR